ncbi:MAG TPA: glycosyltransferase [Gemmataceae bacterium]|nr:glycosyltransferase [Gemmataceae bacterium]
MNIVHLTASTFYGGPERQILGLCRALADADRSTVLTFSEGGRCGAFLAEARRQDVEAAELAHDSPRFRATVADIAAELERRKTDVLLCNGYKANLLGRLAARRVGVPAAAVSRGWTGENFRIRLYEAVDRLHLRCMDRVVCVSEAQARKVRRAGARPEHVRVIYNAVDPERFEEADPIYRAELLRYFGRPPRCIVGAAGRLSPEKGFRILVAAARRVIKRDPAVGFVVFGEGACRARLARQIERAGLVSSFVLAGFRSDLDRLLPCFDLLALPSFTEGMPNVVLEAFAAGVPVVSTAVGGAPEAVEDGVNGFLVRAGDATALADRIATALASEERLRDMGWQGRQRVHEQFTFAAQARGYRRLFAELKSASPVVAEMADLCER